MLQTDFLLIGSGVAGLSLAIKLAELNPQKTITICTKATPSEGSTDFAQGGIAVVTNTFVDSYDKHIQDTMVCGHQLSNPSVVEKVVCDAPMRLHDLEKWGFRADKDENGNFKLGREGGHSENRIIHHQDQTGHEIERALLQKIKDYSNIQVLPYHFAIDLLVDKGTCYGIFVYNEQDEVQEIRSAITVLATGGIGQVYGHTTNPSVSTGDGIAMAKRAGVPVEDMEFVQFHPTAMYMPDNKTTFLISEAVRGAGGILRNNKGEPFMEKYHLLKDLAPRDIVSQSIETEMEQTRSDFVYLDCTAIPSQEFENHFPTITKKCLENGIDVHSTFIPVAPAQHYLCGGIVVDSHGRTSIQQLYACGECTKTGLHGANRLASNSLLEALIYADSIAHTLNDSATQLSNDFPSFQFQTSKSTVNIPDDFVVALRKKLNKLMMQYASIVREKEKLQTAFNHLKQLHLEITNAIDSSKPNRKALELKNMIEVSQLIVKQSIQRKESIGTFKIK